MCPNPDSRDLEDKVKIQMKELVTIGYYRVKCRREWCLENVDDLRLKSKKTPPKNPRKAKEGEPEHRVWRFHQQ